MAHTRRTTDDDRTLHAPADGGGLGRRGEAGHLARGRAAGLRGAGAARRDPGRTCRRSCARAPRSTSQRMREIEREVAHDVIAFVTSVAEVLRSRGPLPAPRPDLVRRARHGVRGAARARRRSADRRRHRACATRFARRPQRYTRHGRWSGARTASTPSRSPSASSWPAGTPRCSATSRRLRGAREAVRFGKLSGAVGTFAHLSPDVEAYVCERLGLRPEPVATQVVPRDRHAQFFSTLAIVAGSIERFAARDPPPAAQRGRRGAGAVRRRAEGLVGDAAQAQPDPDGERHRPGAPGARLRRRGVRERRAVARARHQPLVGRARHRPRRDASRSTSCCTA